MAARLREQFPVFPTEAAPEADLELYHLGNSPAHAWVYRAACARPGVAVLHDWSLHHLVLCETVERGDVGGYLREMRRAHGETGTFVGRQVARALGGELLPALFPLNDRVLEGSLAVVGLTDYVRSRAARRLPGRPVLHPNPAEVDLAFDVSLAGLAAEGVHREERWHRPELREGPELAHRAVHFFELDEDERREVVVQDRRLNVGR